MKRETGKGSMGYIKEVKKEESIKLVKMRRCEEGKDEKMIPEIEK